ncbi:MAG: UPF0179 family protein, partial [Promethearchaeota archaeon]
PKPFMLSFPIKSAFEKMRIKYHPTPCDNKECKYHVNCNPPVSLIRKGMIVEIIEISKSIKDECKYNKNLHLIKVEIVE